MTTITKTTVTETIRIEISSRETRLRQLLSDVAAENEGGHLPSKADLTRGLPSRTRSNHYRSLDTLISRHAVANRSEDGNRYQLEVTDAGHRLLAGETAFVAEVTRTVDAIRSWAVTEHTVDGSRFINTYETEAEAQTAARSAAAKPEHLSAVTVTERLHQGYSQHGPTISSETHTVWTR